ncbi:ABC transporter [Mycobacterium sp. Root265]|uniref:ABC transporter permease n=1 Tax=Mycobacterium sp. Root265 TaxID=1736504 RepID=UPI00070C32E5|nr:ABC transporter permease [Mycobacterium sp. Root265]KRD20443.1 ABC transporter [Mycobacterium sp. Root265]
MSPAVILTARILERSRVDLSFGVFSALVGLIGLTVALRDVIATGAVSYADYVLPAVVVQAMLFGALTTTDRAAAETMNAMGFRLRTMPISQYAPLAARMNYCLLRGLLAIVAAIVGALIFGFRFTGGIGYTVAFFALALLLTLALSLGADTIGVRAKRGEVASQLLLVPQTLIVLLSTGIAPLEAFPTWLQPFVRYQPISQITETLRGFTTGQVDPTNLMVTMIWCVGMLVVFGIAALRLQRRTQ